MSRRTPWSAFRALDIPNEPMTMDGFRAMARTILDEVLGFRPDFIEHQLAHAVRDPNGRAYNRTKARRSSRGPWVLDRVDGTPLIGSTRKSCLHGATCQRTARSCLPQAKSSQPSVNLSEGVLLPLIRCTITKRVRTFHK